MAYPLPEGSLLHVDACCWIDLFATDCIEAVVKAVPYRWTVPEYVLREEVLSVLSSTGREEACDFKPLLRQGLVVVLPIQTAAEKEALVQFAAHLDDGEASVCALARTHGGGVATNDRKVKAVIERLSLQIPVLQTPEILFRWAERTRPSRDKVKSVLQNVTARARFSPRKGIPHADWWYEILKEEES